MHRSRSLGAPLAAAQPAQRPAIAQTVLGAPLVGGQRDVPERARVRVEEPTAEPVQAVVAPPAADSKPAAVD